MSEANMGCVKTVRVFRDGKIPGVTCNLLQHASNYHAGSSML